MNRIVKEMSLSLSRPFERYNSFSEKGDIISRREQDVDNFIKRVTPQIKEYLDLGISFETPEEWDKGLSLSTLGKGKRSSSSILSRMEWDQFLLRIGEIVAQF